MTAGTTTPEVEALLAELAQLPAPRRGLPLLLSVGRLHV